MIAPTPADLIDFETAHPVHNGDKEEAIRDRFGVEPARYYMLLVPALGTMEALRHDPIGVRRIQERLGPKQEARVRCSLGVPFEVA